MNDTPNKPNDEPFVQYADLYACYRNGIHEVKVGVHAGSDIRLLLALAFVATTVVAVVLALMEQALCATAVVVLLLLEVGAGMVIILTNGKTRKESANQPSHAGLGPSGEDPSGRVTK